MPAVIISSSTLAKTEAEFFSYGAEEDPERVSESDALVGNALDHLLFGYWPSLPTLRSRWSYWISEAGVSHALAETDAVIESVANLSSFEHPDLNELADRALAALASQNIEPERWARRIAEDVADAND